MTRFRLWALLSLLVAGAATAQSQAVWRCGADGRSYGDAPCPDGQVVAVADFRSASAVAEARQVVARDQRLARQLAAERKEREREALSRGSGLSGIKPVDELRPKAKVRPEARRPAAKRRPPAATAGTSAATARGSLQRLD